MGPLEAVLGYSLMAGAVWLIAVLLRRVEGFDTVGAVLLAFVLVFGVGSIVFFLWICVYSNYC